MAFFNNAAAKAEADASTVFFVTTRLSAVDAVKAVVKAFGGSTSAKRFIAAVASGSEDVTMEVHAPFGSDPSTAVLRMRIDTEWEGDGVRVMLGIADYQLYSKFGMPAFGALTTAIKKRDKAIQRLQPIDVVAQ